MIGERQCSNESPPPDEELKEISVYKEGLFKYIGYISLFSDKDVKP